MMTRFDLGGRAPHAVSLAAAFLLVTALPAFAQGTPEQREACTPDAINLCQDTIPDVEKTTACMQSHVAELSPKCRAFFSDAPGASPPPPDTQAEAPPPEETYANDDGLGSYRAQVAKWCEQGTIDPFTCRNTKDALHMR